MISNSPEDVQSSFILYTDPELPPGWKRKVVKRLNGSRYDVYIYSPTGKRFRSKKQLQDYFVKNTQLEFYIDQFSFSLTKDKNGARTRLTKLKKSKKLNEKSNQVTKNITQEPDPQILPYQSLTLSSNNPIPMNQLLIITQPQPQLVIQVFNHPPLYQEQELGEDIQGEDAIVSDTESNHDDNDIKSLIRTVALQTLLPKKVDEQVHSVSNLIAMEIEALTELEELDLYYDFDYVREVQDEEKRVWCKSIFDEDSDVIL